LRRDDALRGDRAAALRRGRVPDLVAPGIDTALPADDPARRGRQRHRATDAGRGSGGVRPLRGPGLPRIRRRCPERDRQWPGIRACLGITIRRGLPARLVPDRNRRSARV
ncbi:MAG: hypothetical protein AVDCRST_MAG33-2451, partial [uncultured Thermomicrobiales bacterium]